MAVKRSIDIVLGAVLAIAATPVIVAVAIVVAARLRTWPFFVQPRMGRGGRHFRFVKIRTLPRWVVTDADKYDLERLALPRWSRALRRTHLDELPQLYLVPLGRMSLVGPRPEMPRLHALLPDEFAAARTSVRPGITGPWQISPAVTGLIGEAPEYDLGYLAGRSTALDLWVLWRTAHILGTGRTTSTAAIRAWSDRSIASDARPLSRPQEPRRA